MHFVCFLTYFFYYFFNLAHDAELSVKLMVAILGFTAANLFIDIFICKRF